MRKRMVKASALLMLVAALTISSLGFSPQKAEAGYDDNYSRLYYDLARLVYLAEDDTNRKVAIQTSLNNLHAPIVNGVRQKKFIVEDAVNISTRSTHAMSTSSVTGSRLSLDDTGFKAMAVRVVGSNKVFVAFSGTDSANLSVIADARTAEATLSSNTPGQAYHAQLYVNYLIKSKNWSTKDFYLTGHSLGGWLTSKLYLDIRAANWLIPTTEKFRYGGPVRANVKGVYNFNPLPIRKSQIEKTGQWNANKQGVYNADVKNLYIDNEWLNGVADMHPTQLDYIGVEGRVTNEKLPYYTALSYYPSAAPLKDLLGYYIHAGNWKMAVRDYHGIKYLKQYTY